MKKEIKIQYYDSPAGKLILGSMDEKLCICDWVNAPDSQKSLDQLARKLKAEFVETESDIITKAIAELEEYFDRKRTTFSIPLTTFGTEFQEAVWQALQDIPYGQTISYLTLAQAVNCPKGYRAVAMANHMNLISIFIPCHRVIGSNSKLVGYGGGLDSKRILLETESNSLFHFKDHS